MDSTILASIIASIIALLVGVSNIFFKKTFSDKTRWILGTFSFTFSIVLIICILFFGSHINILNAQLKFYEQSKGWQLPNTIQALNEASELFKLNIEERKLFDKQKVYLDELSEKVSELENQNKQLQERITYLKELTVAPKEIILNEGESIELIKNKVYLALTETSGTLVFVYIDNFYTSLHLGETYFFHDSGLMYNITPRSIGNQTATFDFLEESQ